VLRRPLESELWTNLGPNVKRASSYGFIAPTTVDVSELRAHLDGRAATSGSQPIRGVIYATGASAYVVGDLVARTNEVTITAGRAPGWVTLKFASPVRLTAGFYALGLHSGGSTAVGRYAAVPSWGPLFYDSDAYSDGASSAFGTASVDGKHMSIVAIGG
jgi:hypothetical protein